MVTKTISPELIQQCQRSQNRSCHVDSDDKNKKKGTTRLLFMLTVLHRTSHSQMTYEMIVHLAKSLSLCEHCARHTHAPQPRPACWYHNFDRVPAEHQGSQWSACDIYNCAHTRARMHTRERTRARNARNHLPTHPDSYRKIDWPILLEAGASY